MNDVLEPPDEPGQAVTGTTDPVPGTDAVDVAAYSAFYRAEVTPLVNFLLWMGAGLADAADLAQDTMIDAYRTWPTIQHPRAWVRRVASRKLGRSVINREDALPAEDRTPLLRAPIAEWEQRHEVLRLLKTLPWRQRQVMAWSFDGYSPQDIATELGITPEAARTSLKNARRALAAELAR